ncbi:MAG: hypothetical protein ACLRWM_05680 [Streptococcus sp.]
MMPGESERTDGSLLWCFMRRIAPSIHRRCFGSKPHQSKKLLITAGVYESEMAEKVQDTFEEYRETQSYKAILSTANTIQLSKASVTSYLPYRKGVYFPSRADKEKISVGAERREIQSDKKTEIRADRGASVGDGLALLWCAI